MTRKDFSFIARLIRRARAEGLISQRVLCAITTLVADELAIEYTNFVRVKFLQAIHSSKEETT